MPLYVHLQFRKPALLTKAERANIQNKIAFGDLNICRYHSSDVRTEVSIANLVKLAFDQIGYVDLQSVWAW